MIRSVILGNDPLYFASLVILGHQSWKISEELLNKETFYVIF